jgi:hypothetical protein
MGKRKGKRIGREEAIRETLGNKYQALAGKSFGSK